MHCHATTTGLNKGNSIALVGHPNVGKSVIFQRLTGQRVTVSNYPGTTVEVARGAVRALPDLTLVDTPGVVTLPPLSEDERVTARVLLQEPLRAIVQVGDGKSLRRTLGLTVLLAEMGLPLALVLNMMDEAGQRGVEINLPALSAALDIPVIPATAIRGEGIPQIVSALQTDESPGFAIEYPTVVERAVVQIISRLPQTPVAPRSLALLWLSGDPVSDAWLREHADAGDLAAMAQVRDEAEADALGTHAASLQRLIQEARQAWVQEIISKTLTQNHDRRLHLATRLSAWTTHPVLGLPILALVLYAIYWFVGVFGAGTLVGLLEEDLFGGWLNPLVTRLISHIPIPLVVDFLVGEYGVWTMGMTYALALILPIVATFFIAFSILEDSGYLPRLAALSNRLFAALGLNGKAVLPMVLGLGCVTMATLTTRVLETRRERLLVTLMLALAIPCSAQLGVVMGMLASISLGATLLWAGVVFLVLVTVGWLAARLTPGDRTPLLVELPPLRLPQLSNVLLKTLARMEWYLKEVIPLFLFGAAFLFVLDKTGLLVWLARIGEPLVGGWLGLPPEASAAFLVGFLRRDFGATGLFLMQSQGLLSPLQVVVAMVTITLFIPCIASVMMISRERGWRSALGMLVFIMPLAFLVGGLLQRVLVFTGWIG